METSELAKQYDKLQLAFFSFAATADAFHKQYALCLAQVAKDSTSPIVITKQIDSCFVTEVPASLMRGKIVVQEQRQIIMHSHITYYKAVGVNYELQPGEKYLSVGNLKTV